jgi:hypothetical protein
MNFEVEKEGRLGSNSSSLLQKLHWPQLFIF